MLPSRKGVQRNTRGERRCPPVEKSTGGLKIHRWESTGRSKKSSGGLSCTQVSVAPPGAPAVPRSARQQNEQARPVPNREDRSIVKLKILLQSWFPLRIRVLPNSGRPSGLLIGLEITVR